MNLDLTNFQDSSTKILLSIHKKYLPVELTITSFAVKVNGLTIVIKHKLASWIFNHKIRCKTIRSNPKGHEYNVKHGKHIQFSPLHKTSARALRPVINEASN